MSDVHVRQETMTIAAVKGEEPDHYHRETVAAPSRRTMVSYIPEPYERAYYEGLFAAADVQGAGTIDGNTAVQFFSRSKLPKEALNNVWALADQPPQNSLNFAKFSVALRLIQLLQNGVKGNGPYYLLAPPGAVLRPVHLEGVSGVTVPMPTTLTLHQLAPIIPCSEPPRPQLPMPAPSPQLQTMSHIPQPQVPIPSFPPPPKQQQAIHQQHQQPRPQLPMPTPTPQLQTTSHIPQVPTPSFPPPPPKQQQAIHQQQPLPAPMPSHVPQLQQSQHQQVQYQQQQPPPLQVADSMSDSISLAAPDPYTLTLTEQSRYESIFLDFCREDGYVYANDAFQLFCKSGLPREQLVAICKMVDEPMDSRLDKLEFTLAMHMIACVGRKNLPMPLTLPASLEWLKWQQASSSSRLSHQQPGTLSLTSNAVVPSAAANGFSSMSQQLQQQQRPSLSLGQRPPSIPRTVTNDTHGSGIMTCSPQLHAGGMSVSCAFEGPVPVIDDTRPCLAPNAPVVQTTGSFGEANNNNMQIPMSWQQQPAYPLQQNVPQIPPITVQTTSCNTECSSGDLCASGPASGDLLDCSTGTGEYEFIPIETCEQPMIPATAQKERRNYEHECRALWSQLQMESQPAFFHLDTRQWFVADRSETLYSEIEAVAFEEGLGFVKKASKAGQKGIFFQGFHVEIIQSKITALLSPPSKHFVVEERDCVDRVMASLRRLLRSMWGQRAITSSKHVLIQLDGDSKICVCGVHSESASGNDTVRSALEAINFRIMQGNFNEQVKCRCCMEEHDHDQGVACENGHFYCTVERCFATAVTTQVNQIRSRDFDRLVCPECQAPYNTRDVAAHLPNDVWETVHKAIIDKNVEKEANVLAREFDDRLEAKIREMTSQYGDASAALKAFAQKEALKARNTIMNLCCPHCGIVYFEFTGCMALQCQSCKGNFCGYCHKRATDGRSVHLHVRECPMNTDSRGSYYATEEVVRDAQRRYRIGELKNFLSRFLKDQQNAIVIELTRDLKDLEIEPASLFEF